MPSGQSGAGVPSSARTASSHIALRCMNVFQCNQKNASVYSSVHFLRIIEILVAPYSRLRCWVPVAHRQCADESAWKSRVIDQILTDRFESGSASACSDLSSYCGGTWAGIGKQLDYIQGLRASLVRQCLHQQSRRHGVRCNMDQPDGLQYSKRLSRLLDARPLRLQPQLREQVRSSSADSGSATPETCSLCSMSSGTTSAKLTCTSAKLTCVAESSVCPRAFTHVVTQGLLTNSALQRSERLPRQVPDHRFQ